MALRQVIGSVVALFVLSSTGAAQGCLIDAMPISEDVLLDPRDRWDPVEVDDLKRDSLLLLFEFVDSTGALLPDYEVYLLDNCQLFEEDPMGVTISVYDIHHVIEDEREDRDESFYVATSLHSDHIDHLCIGQIKTTCSLTYLMGSFMAESGLIELQSLEHTFDCETTEYVSTENLSPVRFELLDDGSFVDAPSQEPEGDTVD